MDDAIRRELDELIKRELPKYCGAASLSARLRKRRREYLRGDLEEIKRVRRWLSGPDVDSEGPIGEAVNKLLTKTRAPRKLLQKQLQEIEDDARAGLRGGRPHQLTPIACAARAWLDDRGITRRAEQVHEIAASLDRAGYRSAQSVHSGPEGTRARRILKLVGELQVIFSTRRKKIK